MGCTLGMAVDGTKVGEALHGILKSEMHASYLR